MIVESVNIILIYKYILSALLSYYLNYTSNYEIDKNPLLRWADWQRQQQSY